MKNNISHRTYRTTWPLTHAFHTNKCIVLKTIRKPPLAEAQTALGKQKIRLLTRVSTLTLDIDIAILSVCLTVRDVPALDKNGLTYCHSSSITLVLSASNTFTKLRRVTPCGGAKYRWDIKISRFSTNKSLYLADDTRQRHSYYWKRTGNRTQAFKWY